MKNKKFVSLVCIILAALMLFGVLFTALGSITASAVSQSEIDALEEKRDEIREKQKDLSEQIDALESEMASVIEQKTALDEQNELNRQDIELINQQIELYEGLVEEKAVELEEALAAEQQQYESYRARVRAMEENDTWNYIAILFKAKSLASFLSMLDDIFEIMTYDKAVEEDYIAAREKVEEVKAEYEAVQAEMEVKKDELLLEKERLEEQIEYAFALIAALEEDIEAYKLAYSENEELEDEVQSEIDRLTKQLQDEEAARKAAEMAAQAKPNTNTTGGGSTAAGTNANGYYYWPTQSCTYITSCFGYRVHPIFGTTKYHAGVDIAAGAGATISAAAAGTVTIAEYSSSYGNYVVIYHPNGSTTLYAHMSQMAVSVGQSVSKGQTIGYVGSTGWSTGPHLHFEIRVNGSCVDPLQYYSINFSYSPSA